MNDALPKVRVHFAGSDDQPRAQMALAWVLFNPDDPMLHAHPHFLSAYEPLLANAREFCEPAAMDQAQVVVYRYWLDHKPGEPERAEQVAAAAKAAGLPCLFFQLFDHGVPCIPSYGQVYQTSVDGGRRAANEHAMVPETDDMLADRGGQVQVRDKAERPIVGFCGNVGTRWQEPILRMLGHAAKVEGAVIRRRVMRTLRRSKRVQTRFLPRRQFWGGAVTRKKFDREQQLRMRQQYIDNMLGSDYTLCIRGTGNFSFRFYETLSAGRIPLFINTRCVLPFEDEIDWAKHCVMVDESELDRAGEILADFHAGISNDDFRAMQTANRRLWEQYLRPDRFYAHVLERARRKRLAQ